MKVPPFDAIFLQKALANMEDRGGHFASSLAKAWRFADADNSLRLWGAFHHIVAGYARDGAMSHPHDGDDWRGSPAAEEWHHERLRVIARLRLIIYDLANLEMSSMFEGRSCPLSELKVSASAVADQIDNWRYV